MGRGMWGNCRAGVGHFLTAHRRSAAWGCDTGAGRHSEPGDNRHGGMMTGTLGQAKAVARAWVAEQAAAHPDLTGAFLHGSGTELPDDAILPETSDLDVMLVGPGPTPPLRTGKFRRDGVLIEASWLPASEVRSPDYVLGQYHLAGSFRSPSILLDRDGHLARIQAVVSEQFTWRRWVRVRCAHARDKVLTGYRLSSDDPLPDQVIAWLFPAAICCHVLLVAGLRNPTVRRRYETTRALLTDYGQLGIYDDLLGLIGARTTTPEQASAVLDGLERVFDTAAAVARTPFPFLADINADARAVAIDGSRSLIARGSHREAMFWLAVTWSRCMKVLLADAPELAARYDGDYRRVLAMLGIQSSANLVAGRQAINAFLPRVWDVAEAIMRANPGIINVSGEG